MDALVGVVQHGFGDRRIYVGGDLARLLREGGVVVRLAGLLGTSGGPRVVVRGEVGLLAVGGEVGLLVVVRGEVGRLVVVRGEVGRLVVGNWRVVRTLLEVLNIADVIAMIALRVAMRVIAAALWIVAAFALLEIPMVRAVQTLVIVLNKAVVAGLTAVWPIVGLDALSGRFAVGAIALPSPLVVGVGVVSRPLRPIAHDPTVHVVGLLRRIFLLRTIEHFFELV